MLCSGNSHSKNLGTQAEAEGWCQPSHGNQILGLWCHFRFCNHGFCPLGSDCYRNVSEESHKWTTITWVRRDLSALILLLALQDLFPQDSSKCVMTDTFRKKVLACIFLWVSETHLAPLNTLQIERCNWMFSYQYTHSDCDVYILYTSLFYRWKCIYVTSLSLFCELEQESDWGEWYSPHLNVPYTTERWVPKCLPWKGGCWQELLQNGPVSQKWGTPGGKESLTY